MYYTGYGYCCNKQTQKVTDNKRFGFKDGPILFRIIPLDVTCLPNVFQCGGRDSVTPNTLSNTDRTMLGSRTRSDLDPQWFYLLMLIESKYLLKCVLNWPNPSSYFSVQIEWYSYFIYVHFYHYVCILM